MQFPWPGRPCLLPCGSACSEPRRRDPSAGARRRVRFRRWSGQVSCPTSRSRSLRSGGLTVLDGRFRRVRTDPAGVIGQATPRVAVREGQGAPCDCIGGQDNEDDEHRVSLRSPARNGAVRSIDTPMRQPRSGIGAVTEGLNPSGVFLTLGAPADDRRLPALTCINAFVNAENRRGRTSVRGGLGRRSRRARTRES